MKSIFLAPKYQLYLLQLENYELVRYWKLLGSKGLWTHGVQRKELVWTQKARALFVMAIALHVLFLFVVYHEIYFASLAQFILALLVGIGAGYVFYFIFYSIALIVLWPFDWLLKKIIVARACALVSKTSHLTVIAVAGSYGKTTMKYVISSVLGTKKRVVATPESYNVPVSIARFILKEVNEHTEVLILEMGEHHPGDVKELCAIAQPSISVVTGINESHLERFGNLERTIETIFEVVKYSKEDALILLNADDKLVRENFKKFTQGKKLFWYSAHNQNSSSLQSDDVQFLESALQQTFDLKDGNRTVGSYRTNLLGGYVVGDIMAAVFLAKELGVTEADTVQGVSMIKPVSHRLEPIRGKQDVLVIDDSYNGNPDGVREAIAVLGKFTGRRKLFITPGLVETGASAAYIHETIGRELARVADKVLLIKNSVTGFIEVGLLAENFPQEHIMWFDSTAEAHAQLGAVLQPGDVIVFQNDWGDQYK